MINQYSLIAATFGISREVLASATKDFTGVIEIRGNSPNFSMELPLADFFNKLSEELKSGKHNIIIPT